MSITLFEMKYGTTRSVLLVGSYAIKIPSMVEWRLFLCGLLANMQEKKFSDTGWFELCPVVFVVPGGFLSVMKRARPLTPEEFQEIPISWVRQGEYVVPVEWKQDSFGVLDGRIVAVDYGS